MRHILLFGIVVTIPLISMAQHATKQPRAFGFTASLPWISNYHYYDYKLNTPSSKSGFVGLGASTFYKKGRNKFSLNFGFTSDLPAPIGAFDYSKKGTRTNISSTYWEGLYHGKLFDKVTMMAGLNYTRYRFNFTSYLDTLPSYSSLDKTIGLTIGTEYNFSKNSSIALFYRPAIISLDKKQYWHLISVDLRFDINVWRKE